MLKNESWISYTFDSYGLNFNEKFNFSSKFWNILTFIITKMTEWLRNFEMFALWESSMLIHVT